MLRKGCFFDLVHEFKVGRSLAELAVGVHGFPEGLAVLSLLGGRGPGHVAFDVGEFEDGTGEPDVAAVDEVAEARVGVQPFGKGVPVESQADVGVGHCGLYEVVGAV